MPTQADHVRRYYDTNTPAFRQFGQSRNDGVIRRAVWGPGVTTRTEAFRYVDRLIAADLQRLRQEPSAVPARVFDFGCGFGSSLLLLFAEHEVEGVGVTISALQARVAQERFAAAHAEHRLRCVQADFLALPEDLAPADLVFAIEAFVHSPNPRLFFQAAARQLKAGGTLIVCDDFLISRAAGPLTKRERRWIAEFRHGWVAPSTVTTLEANAAADHAGFEPMKNEDLTPFLELRRPRDRALSWLVAVARGLPIPGYRWRSLVGGNALQMALLSGLIEHRYMRWRRTA